MQHTEKYHFNIIEDTDTFNPDALNANAEAVEAALARVEAETETRVAALEADVGFGTPGKVARIATGSYVGNNSMTSRTLAFDFMPIIVFICGGSSLDPGAVAVFIRGVTGAAALSGNGAHVTITEWTENSVTFTRYNTTTNQLEANNHTMYYMALGVSVDAEGGEETK